MLWRPIAPHSPISSGSRLPEVGCDHVVRPHHDRPAPDGWAALHPRDEGHSFSGCRPACRRRARSAPRSGKTCATHVSKVGLLSADDIDCCVRNSGAADRRHQRHRLRHNPFSNGWIQPIGGSAPTPQRHPSRTTSGDRGGRSRCNLRWSASRRGSLSSSRWLPSFQR